MNSSTVRTCISHSRARAGAATRRPKHHRDAASASASGLSSSSSSRLGRHSHSHSQTYASLSSPPPPATGTDPSALLSKPTWSVRSLLPSSSPSSARASSPDGPVTPATLRHLLRLSALPAPDGADDQLRLLSTLSAQLHFVRAIQSVDTTGVEPLRAIRDETAAGRREQTIGLESLRDALACEDIIGHARRPRRRREKVDAHDVEDWDVLGNASLTAGRHLVVKGGG